MPNHDKDKSAEESVQKPAQGKSADQQPPKPTAKQPVTIAIKRNNEPLTLLSVEESANLEEIRKQLSDRILDNDLFVDEQGFPVPMDKESSWTVKSLLERSAKKEEKTIHLKSTERAPQKSAMERIAETFKALPPEATKLPEIIKEDLKLPDADIKQRQLSFPGLLEKIAVHELSDPIMLKEDDWRQIIKRNNLLHAFRMDSEVPTLSFRKAFSVIGGVPRFIVQDDAYISATVTHSEIEHAQVMSKFAKVEASASYWFVSASMEASQRQRQAQATGKVETYAVGQWNLPRVVLQLRPDDLLADPNLTQQVQEILGRKYSEEAKYNAERQYYDLCKVFQEYGHMWASEITLGGQLTITDRLELTSTFTDSEIEAEIRVAVSVKALSASASAGVATGQSGKTWDKAFEQFQAKNFHATGGDTRLAQQAGDWVATVGPPLSWRVIDRRGLLPLYMVLDAETREKVRNLLSEVDPRLSPQLLEDAPKPRQYLQTEGQPTIAQQDGFLVGRITCVEGKGNCIWGAASGARGMPGDPAAWASVSYSQKIGKQTITLPVKRRDTWDVEPLQAGKASINVFFHRMANLSEPFFDPAEKLAVGNLTKWQPDRDGFLVLAAQCLEDSNGEVSVYVDGQEEKNKYAVFSLAKPYITHLSTCLPVLKAKNYTVISTGKISVTRRYIPINPRIGRLGDPIPSDEGKTYLAESDGFLFGWLKASGTGDGMLKSGADRNNLDETEAEIMLSVEDKIPDGCLGAPIRRNSYYQLEIIPGSKTRGVTTKLQFFPLRWY